MVGVRVAGAVCFWVVGSDLCRLVGGSIEAWWVMWGAAFVPFCLGLLRVWVGDSWW